LLQKPLFILIIQIFKKIPEFVRRTFFNLATFEKKTCPIILVALTAHHTPN